MAARTKADPDTRMVCDEFERRYGKARHMLGEEVQQALLSSVVMYFMTMRYDAMKESPEKYPATYYVELHGKCLTHIFGE